MENRALTDLIGQLSCEPRVWVRIAAHRPKGKWHVGVLEVTTQEPPPLWIRRRWQYPRALFLATAPAGKTVGRWFSRGRIPLVSGAFKVELHDTCSVEGHDASAGGIFEPLRWPTTQWSLSAHEVSRESPPQGELVATGAPAFFGFDQAALAFFGVEHVRNRNFSEREIVVRQQDRPARIDSVLVQPTRVVVGLSGDDLRGTAITLSGAGGPTRELARRTRQVRLATPNGLPAGAWLVGLPGTFDSKRHGSGSD